MDRFIPKEEPAEPEPDNKVDALQNDKGSEMYSVFMSNFISCFSAVTNKGCYWTLYRPGGGATGALCKASRSILPADRKKEW